MMALYDYGQKIKQISISACVKDIYFKKMTVTVRDRLIHTRKYNVNAIGH